MNRVCGFPWYDRAGENTPGIAIGVFGAAREKPVAHRTHFVTIRDTKHGR